MLVVDLGKPELLTDPRFQNIFDVSTAPVNSPADIFNAPHFKERGFWIEIDHPVTGPVTYPGAPIDMGDGSVVLRRPAPLLGQHNEEILEGLGYAKEDRAILRETGVI